MQSKAHSLWACYHHMFSLCLSLDFKPAGPLVSSAFHSAPNGSPTTVPLWRHLTGPNGASFITWIVRKCDKYFYKAKLL